MSEIHSVYASCMNRQDQLHRSYFLLYIKSRCRTVVKTCPIFHVSQPLSFTTSNYSYELYRYTEYVRTSTRVFLLLSSQAPKFLLRKNLFGKCWFLTLINIQVFISTWCFSSGSSVKNYFIWLLSGIQSLMLSGYMGCLGARSRSSSLPLLDPFF